MLLHNLLKVFHLSLVTFSKFCHLVLDGHPIIVCDLCEISDAIWSLMIDLHGFDEDVRSMLKPYGVVIVSRELAFHSQDLYVVHLLNVVAHLIDLL